MINKLTGHSLRAGFGLLFASLFSFGVMAQCPTPVFCTPGTATNPNANSLKTGIDNVILNNIPFDFFGALQGYQDRSCLDTIRVFSGTNISVRILTGTATASAQENVRAWLDVNNDGVFDNTELVYSSNNARVHTGNISLPATTVNGVYLRLRVASDLFSVSTPTFCGTPQYGQTVDLGIFVTPNLLKPVAHFSTPDTLTCSGGVNFTDFSNNGPTSWVWDFGDTTFSTAQNPFKQYRRSGIYTVRLIASNNNGADTITKVNYIVFNDTIPAAASCVPTTVNPCCGYQLRNFSIGTLNASQFPVSNSYQDFTCRTRTKLYLGNLYRISMTTGAQQAQDTKAWLDLNNDGLFNDTSELIFSALNAFNPSGYITIPSNSQKDVPLRLRVSSDVAGVAISPCNNNVSGQTQDYTIILLENTNPPIASFSVDTGSPCRKDYGFQFTGANTVDSLFWNFGDGNSLSTTSFSVNHTYTGPGYYKVSLKVVGPFGQDSIAIDSAVKILPTPIATTCPTNATQPFANLGIFQVNFGGVINNSGGANQGYGDFTCNYLMRAGFGDTLPISVLTGTNNIEYVRAWIDYNNNGVFEATEQAFQSSATRNHSGTIIISNAAAINIPLRFRIASDGGAGGGPGGGNPNWPNPCSPVRFGQIEEYTIMIDGTPQAPRANFNASKTNTCYTEIAFSDSSLYGPTQWAWDFGDGGASTDRNPIHTYLTPGTYSVKLKVSNASGVDSLTKTNLVTIFSGNGLKEACTPNNSIPGFGVGIRSVTLNTLSKTNTAAELNIFYIDRACSDTTFLLEDTPFPMTVTTRNNGNEVLAGWVDWNNNGTFETAEQFVNSQATGNHNFTMRPPANAVQNVRLRMRLRSDFTGGGGGGGGSQVQNPCGTLNVGHTEDYSVVVKPVTFPPMAGFIVDKRNTCNGIVRFTDTSRYLPNRWEWRFGDGTTSIDRNPVHRYTTIGSYDVFLKVWNTYGEDSITNFGIINVTDTIPVPTVVCTPVSATVQPNASVGITRVLFGNFTNTSQPAGREGYRDFTCVGTIELEAGDTTTGFVTVSTRSAENIVGFLDINNDGDFASTEQVFSLTSVQGQQAVRIILPATAPVGARRLLRIMDEFNAPITSSCQRLNWGQAEDYTVIINAFGTGLKGVKAQGLQVYPNPTKDIVRLANPKLGLGNCEVTVLNTLGQSVKSEIFAQESAEFEINLANFNSGVYTLVLKSGSTLYRTKIIKE